MKCYCGVKGSDHQEAGFGEIYSGILFWPLKHLQKEEDIFVYCDQADNGPHPIFVF